MKKIVYGVIATAGLIFSSQVFARGSRPPVQEVHTGGLTVNAAKVPAVVNVMGRIVRIETVGSGTMAFLTRVAPIFEAGATQVEGISRKQFEEFVNYATSVPAAAVTSRNPAEQLSASLAKHIAPVAQGEWDAVSRENYTTLINAFRHNVSTKHMTPANAMEAAIASFASSVGLNRRQIKEKAEEINEACRV